MIHTIQRKRYLLILLICVIFSFHLQAQYSDPVNKSEPADSVTVGVHYYPWYTGGSGGRALRYHLQPLQYAYLGTNTTLYDSRKKDVIDQHITWSKQSQIDVWFVSWWGPDSHTDNSLQDHLLKHERIGEIQYAILYESTGRLGDMSSPDYSRLVSDFEYLHDNYFDDSNYYKINGKPVVFIYLSRVYFRNNGDEALKELRNKFPNLYLLGDDVFGPNYSFSSDAQELDAISAYDVYGQSTGQLGSTQEAIDQLKKNYDDAIEVADGVNTDFVPAITPGFNDRAVREGHSAAPRYFEDTLNSHDGELFLSMMREVAMPRTQYNPDNLILITSFNEWWEDTQIEPTAGTSGSTDEDDSGTGIYYTQGYKYTDYGTLYLNILDQVLYNPSARMIADAGPDQSIEDRDENGMELVTLDGSNSFDSKGGIKNYFWTEEGAYIAAGSKPSVELSTGNHSIKLTVEDSAGAVTTDELKIEIKDMATGMKETTDSKVNLYPSPVSEVLNVQTGDDEVISIKIYDTQGKIVKEVRHRSGIDLSGLASGLYIVEITTDKNKTVRKVSVE
jgi:hypothetical protein